MPQEFHVLRCFSCETFQVQIVKKVNKWACKMCGEKQSVKKEYGRGTGKECRLHVQKLNKIRIETATTNVVKKKEFGFNETIENDLKSSKWSEFISEDKSNDSDVEDTKYTFERPVKRKFQSQNMSRKKIKKDKNTDELKDHSESVKTSEELKKKLNNIGDDKLEGRMVKESKWDKFSEDTDDRHGSRKTNEIFEDLEVRSENVETSDELKDFLNNIGVDVKRQEAGAVKKLKWDNFSENYNDFSESSGQNNEMCKGNIFQSKDDNIDDVLNF